MPQSIPPDSRSQAAKSNREAAKPRFWGPASYWRLGLVALLIVIVLIAILNR